MNKNWEEFSDALKEELIALQEFFCTNSGGKNLFSSSVGIGGSEGFVTRGDMFYVMDCHQVSLFTLSECKRIIQLLLPLKLSENLRFSNNFRGSRS